MPLDSGARLHTGAEIDAQYGGGSIAVVTPLTGATVAFGPNQPLMYVNPAGTLAALTVLLPPNPVAGQKAGMSFSQTVTALTLQTATGGAVGTNNGVIANELMYRYVGGAWVAWD